MGFYFFNRNSITDILLARLKRSHSEILESAFWYLVVPSGSWDITCWSFAIVRQWRKNHHLRPFLKNYLFKLTFYLINVLFGAFVDWLPSFRTIGALVVEKSRLKTLILAIFDKNWPKVAKMRFQAFSRKKLSSTSANPKTMKISTIMDHNTSIVR